MRASARSGKRDPYLIDPAGGNRGREVADGAQYLATGNAGAELGPVVIVEPDDLEAGPARITQPLGDVASERACPDDRDPPQVASMASQLAQDHA